MPEQMKVGCARPTGGPVGEEGKEEIKRENVEQITAKEVPMIKIGKKVPDFTAPAYLNGNFVNIKLSEYLGKWIVLCFYPGDFTFV